MKKKNGGWRRKEHWCVGDDSQGSSGSLPVAGGGVDKLGQEPGGLTRSRELTYVEGPVGARQ